MLINDERTPLKNKDQTTINIIGEDRLSILPKDIMHHKIFSYFDRYHHVACLSRVSKGMQLITKESGMGKKINKLNGAIPSATAEFIAPRDTLDDFFAIYGTASLLYGCYDLFILTLLGFNIVTNSIRDLELSSNIGISAGISLAITLFCTHLLRGRNIENSAIVCNAISDFLFHWIKNIILLHYSSALNSAICSTKESALTETGISYGLGLLACIAMHALNIPRNQILIELGKIYAIDIKKSMELKMELVFQDLINDGHNKIYTLNTLPTSHDEKAEKYLQLTTINGLWKSDENQIQKQIFTKKELKGLSENDVISIYQKVQDEIEENKKDTCITVSF